MSQNTTEEIKAIARRYVDVWNQHDPAALDTVFAANAVRHDPATGVARSQGCEQALRRQ